MRRFTSDCWGNLHDHNGTIGTSDQSGVFYAVKILNEQQAEIERLKKKLLTASTALLIEEINTRIASNKKVLAHGDLAECNYCTLKYIKKRAKSIGLQVIIKGYEVFVIPNDSKLNPDTRANFILLSITDHCCC